MNDDDPAPSEDWIFDPDELLKAARRLVRSILRCEYFDFESGGIEGKIDRDAFRRTCKAAGVSLRVYDDAEAYHRGFTAGLDEAQNRYREQDKQAAEREAGILSRPVNRWAVTAAADAIVDNNLKDAIIGRFGNYDIEVRGRMNLKVLVTDILTAYLTASSGRRLDEIC